MTTFSEKEKIQLLADIVELQTENNNEIDVCNYLTDLFDKYDIKSEILKVNEHRANIVAEIGNGSPILALSGHMDVVDAGNQDNWSYPPFSTDRKRWQIIWPRHYRYERRFNGFGRISNRIKRTK